MSFLDPWDCGGVVWVLSKRNYTINVARTIMRQWVNPLLVVATSGNCVTRRLLGRLFSWPSARPELGVIGDSLPARDSEGEMFIHGMLVERVCTSPLIVA